MIIPFLVLAYTVWHLLWSARAVRRLRGFPHLPSVSSFSHGPLVSIIVAARNEQAHLPACVASLLGLQYNSKEIIIVDDRSTDRTPDILQSTKGICTETINETPSGWVGKCWACYRGYSLASGDLLLFTDADVVHTPMSLSAAVSYQQHHQLDMLTLWPFMRLESFWERVIMPIVFRSFFLDFHGREVNNDAKPWYAGFGPYILITRAAYEKVGGHRAVASSTEEDYQLASLVKGAGLRLRVLFGIDYVRTRMYTSLGEIWKGWLKNAFAGYDFRWLSALAGISLLLATTVLPFAFALVVSFAGGSLLMAAGLFLVLTSWFRDIVLFRVLHCKSRYALLSFLGGLMYALIIFHSGIRHSLGLGVEWKGSIYRSTINKDP